MSQFSNNVSRPELADITATREGAALVGTDTKANLGNATNAEAAFTWLDSWVITTDNAITALEAAVAAIEADIATLDAELDTKADLFAWNDWRLAPGDPNEIRSNYGLTVTRQGDVIFIDSDVVSGDIPTIVAGDGISVDFTGGVYTITCTLVIPDLPTVSGGQGITVVYSGGDYKIHSRESRVVLTDGATVTLDCANDNRFILRMDSARPDRTLALSNMSDGQIITLILVQGASAGNTVTWWSGNNWPEDIEPTLTNTANQADVFTIERIASGILVALTSGQNISNLE